MSCPQEVVVVIDAQYPFVANDDPRIDTLAATCQEARNDGKHICLIEDGHGHPTHDAIKRAVHGYTKLHEGWKRQWDGSLQVAELLKKAGITAPGRLIVCGAFAEECVMATVVGLRNLFPTTPITVIRDACFPAPVNRFSDSDWQWHAKRLSFMLS